MMENQSERQAEAAELENLVNVLGSEEAQEAVAEHQLAELVYTLN